MWTGAWVNSIRRATLTLIVFDLDGTLIDVTRRYSSSFVDSLKRYGADITEDLAVSWRGQGVKPLEKISLLIKKKKHAKECNELRKKLLWSKKYLNMDAPFPYTKETLKRLGKENLIAVCSLRESYELAEEQLKRFELLSLVDSFEVKGAGGNPLEAKKHLISKALERFGVSSTDCCVIGDTTVDILAGSQLGATTVGVLTGLDGRAVLRAAKPDMLIQTIEEFDLALSQPLHRTD